MVEIPNGSVATCAVHFTGLGGGISSSPDTEIAAIGQELQYDGLQITNYSVGLSGLIGTFTGDFYATLYIANQSGQELDDTDLTAQLIDAVNTVYPGATITVSVNQVTGQPGGVNSGSGTTGNTLTTAAGAASEMASGGSSNPPACGDPSLTLFSQYYQQYLSCLTSKGLSTIGLLAIGLLIGVVLIVASEHKGEVAAAAA